MERGRGGFNNREGYYEGNYGYNDYNDYGRYGGRNDADFNIRSPIGNGQFLKNYCIMKIIIKK